MSLNGETWKTGIQRMGIQLYIYLISTHLDFT